MAIQYGENRQRVRAGIVTFNHTDAPAGVFVPLFELPNGAVILSAVTHVLAASTAPTTDVLDFGTAAAPSQLFNDVDAKTAARTASTTLPNAPLTGTQVYGVTRAQTGPAATNGTYALSYTYIILGGSDFTQS
jgi:hypothetical protein